MTTASDRRAIYAARDEVYDPQPASSTLCADVDIALGMKAISIRLPRDMLVWYKHTAKSSGMPYQALMRDVLVESMMSKMDSAKQPSGVDIDAVHRNPRWFDSSAGPGILGCVTRNPELFSEPIETEPADLDDTKRSTEAGAGFIVAVVVTALAICAGLFLAGRMGAL